MADGDSRFGEDLATDATAGNLNTASVDGAFSPGTAAASIDSKPKVDHDSFGIINDKVGDGEVFPTSAGVGVGNAGLRSTPSKRRRASIVIPQKTPQKTPQKAVTVNREGASGAASTANDVGGGRGSGGGGGGGGGSSLDNASITKIINKALEARDDGILDERQLSG